MARTTRDRLTGLENRDAFIDQLDAVLATGQQVALFIIDVDRFAMVNDAYGHEFGDAVLLLMSRRLTSAAGVYALNVALQHGDVIVVSPIVASSPVFALMLAIVVFRRETLTWRTVATIALVVAGVILVILGSQSR